MTTHSRFSVTDYRGKIWDNRISAAPKPNPAGGIAAGQRAFVTVALGSPSGHPSPSAYPEAYILSLVASERGMVDGYVGRHPYAYEV